MIARLILIGLAVLLARPALADNFSQSPIGRLLVIDANTYVFAAPPGGLRSLAKVQGVVGRDNGTVKYYPATPSPSGSGYQLATPAVLPAQAFAVTDYRDVLQGKDTVRWVQITPVGQSAVTGWVSLGSRANPDTSLTLQ